MIQLIASDLDGTLLDSSGRLPEQIFPMIEKLYEKGVLFCAASGRQLCALEKMFAPVRDKAVFIAENGALCAYAGEILSKNLLSEENVLRSLGEVRKIGGAYPLLCTVDCAYYEDDEPVFADFVRASYISNARAEKPLVSLADRSEVCKIAVYDTFGPENNSMKVLPERLAGLRVIQSGGNWLDISDPHVNKGEALRLILKKFGILPENCAAFGDHMNDYEMLLACGHPYVTENAFPPLKKLIGRTIPSNDEGGVLTALADILESA